MINQILLLVEGQSEERFVKDVLKPEFDPRGIYLRPTILNTRIVKDGPNFKGGASSVTKIAADLNRLIHNSGDAVVSTILDYYGLPLDTPGMKSRALHGSALERVKHVESMIFEALGKPKNFVPFLALHEFEAWILSCEHTLPTLLVAPEKQSEFASICSIGSSPEDINETPGGAPSKRILSLFPTYRKALHGPVAARRIGLELIRSKCTHFDAWLSKLEAFAHN